MVRGVLIGVGLGEVGDGAIERVVRAQVGRDGHRVAASGMGAREGPGADAAVETQDLGPERGDVDAALSRRLSAIVAR